MQSENDEVIERPFRLARYPVTVGQFEAFVNAGGYKDVRSGDAARGPLSWWGEEGLAWMRRNGISGPDDSDPVFQTPNHPRVGVSWFEANAFCRWLTERLQASGQIPKSDRIALPSEAQWEWAARWNGQTKAADDRQYPWGGRDTSDLALRCNMRNTGLEHTSAVGLFRSGKADCGAMDLSGNVWEWCDPFAGSGREISVVRGGSWGNEDPENLSCGCRNGVRPLNRYDFIGFRCVWLRGSAR